MSQEEENALVHGLSKMGVKGAGIPSLEPMPVKTGMHKSSGFGDDDDEDLAEIVRAGATILRQDEAAAAPAAAGAGAGAGSMLPPAAQPSVRQRLAQLTPLNAAGEPIYDGGGISAQLVEMWGSPAPAAASAASAGAGAPRPPDLAAAFRLDGLDLPAEYRTPIQPSVLGVYQSGLSLQSDSIARRQLTLPGGGLNTPMPLLGAAPRLRPAAAAASSSNAYAPAAAAAAAIGSQPPLPPPSSQSQTTTSALQWAIRLMYFRIVGYSLGVESDHNRESPNYIAFEPEFKSAVLTPLVYAPDTSAWLRFIGARIESSVGVSQSVDRAIVFDDPNPKQRDPVSLRFSIDETDQPTHIFMARGPIQRRVLLNADVSRTADPVALYVIASHGGAVLYHGQRPPADVMPQTLSFIQLTSDDVSIEYKAQGGWIVAMYRKPGEQKRALDGINHPFRTVPLVLPDAPALAAVVTTTLTDRLKVFGAIAQEPKRALVKAASVESKVEWIPNLSIDYSKHPFQSYANRFGSSDVQNVVNMWNDPKKTGVPAVRGLAATLQSKNRGAWAFLPRITDDLQFRAFLPPADASKRIVDLTAMSWELFHTQIDAKVSDPSVLLKCQFGTVSKLYEGANAIPNFDPASTKILPHYILPPTQEAVQLSDEFFSTPEATAWFGRNKRWLRHYIDFLKHPLTTWVRIPSTWLHNSGAYTRHSASLGYAYAALFVEAALEVIRPDGQHPTGVDVRMNKKATDFARGLCKWPLLGLIQPFTGSAIGRFPSVIHLLLAVEGRSPDAAYVAQHYNPADRLAKDRESALGVIQAAKNVEETKKAREANRKKVRIAPGVHDKQLQLLAEAANVAETQQKFIAAWTKTSEDIEAHIVDAVLDLARRLRLMLHWTPVHGSMPRTSGKRKNMGELEGTADKKTAETASTFVPTPREMYIQVPTAGTQVVLHIHPAYYSATFEANLRTRLGWQSGSVIIPTETNGVYYYREAVAPDQPPPNYIKQLACRIPLFDAKAASGWSATVDKATFERGTAKIIVFYAHENEDISQWKSQFEEFLRTAALPVSSAPAAAAASASADAKSSVPSKPAAAAAAAAASAAAIASAAAAAIDDADVSLLSDDDNLPDEKVSIALAAVGSGLSNRYIAGAVAPAAAPEAVALAHNQIDLFRVQVTSETTSLPMFNGTVTETDMRKRLELLNFYQQTEAQTLGLSDKLAAAITTGGQRRTLEPNWDQRIATADAKSGDLAKILKEYRTALKYEPRYTLQHETAKRVLTRAMESGDTEVVHLMRDIFYSDSKQQQMAQPDTGPKRKAPDANTAPAPAAAAAAAGSGAVVDVGVAPATQIDWKHDADPDGLRLSARFDDYGGYAAAAAASQPFDEDEVDADEDEPEDESPPAAAAAAANDDDADAKEQVAFWQVFWMPRNKWELLPDPRASVSEGSDDDPRPTLNITHAPNQTDFEGVLQVYGAALSPSDERVALSQTPIAIAFRKELTELEKGRSKTVWKIMLYASLSNPKAPVEIVDNVRLGKRVLAGENLRKPLKMLPHILALNAKRAAMKSSTAPAHVRLYGFRIQTLKARSAAAVDKGHIYKKPYAAHEQWEALHAMVLPGVRTSDIPLDDVFKAVADEFFVAHRAAKWWRYEYIAIVVYRDAVDGGDRACLFANQLPRRKDDPSYRHVQCDWSQVSVFDWEARFPVLIQADLDNQVDAKEKEEDDRLFKLVSAMVDSLPGANVSDEEVRAEAAAAKRARTDASGGDQKGGSASPTKNK